MGWMFLHKSFMEKVLLITESFFFLTFYFVLEYSCFPGGSVVKNPPANAGNADLIPGSGRFPGGGNDNPL